MEFSEMNCPPAVIEYVQTIDLTSSDNSMMFSWIEEHADLVCQVHSLVAIARRLDARSNPQVIDDFCSTAATYAPYLKQGAKEAVRAAYLRFPYDSSISMGYFNGLRYNNIDIREHLQGKIPLNWSFVHPRDADAETWDYYLYLASLEQPGAYDALAAKIAQTEDGNDVTNLIQSLADLKTEQTKNILLKYKQDERHAEGPHGPAMKIGETVSIILDTFFRQVP